MLRFYRDATASLPDEIMTFAGLVHAPDGSGAKLAAMLVAHCGDQAAGEKALKPFKNYGAPMMDAIGPIPYSVLNSMLDAGYPKGASNYWKSNFLSALSDGAIDTMIERFAKCASPMDAILLEDFHGAVCRVPVDATAYAQRAKSYNLSILGEWMDHRHTQACMAWTRDTYDAMKPHMAPRRYLNYLGDDEANDSVKAAYGPNFARLQKLKTKYDPANVFHLNQNIPPG